ncbi:MAG TPA: hypothetical protein PLI09_15055 [Candidatus Hydrogenedentes bacterium]|nr:hypothetical protein [Candidatus Hydrogenedentota bacterium]
MKEAPAIPRWVWVIIIALSLVEPVTHGVLLYGLPEGVAPTGLHIGDTAFFLTAMQIFLNGFESPYATCQSPAGYKNITYFVLPLDWLYGVLGVCAAVLHVHRFIVLGIANGLGMMLYLLAVYWFLRSMAPRRANLAFVLFVLCGGVAGMLYIVTGLLGMQGLPGFETWFRRYANYELIEGAFLAPWLMAPRLYYTLPLAIGFASLTLWLRAYREQPGRPGWGSLLLLLAGSYLNARLGPMFMAVAGLYVLMDTRVQWWKRVGYVALYAVPAVITTSLLMLQLRWNPESLENADTILRRCAWLGSMAGLLVWRLVVLPYAARPGWRDLSWLWRCVAGMALGYLAAFAVLYVGYQKYKGTLWAGGDVMAAVAVSDWALLGLVPGVIVSWWLRPKAAACPEASEAEELKAQTPLGWFWLWFLLFLAVAVSAFGQGRFLSLTPERMMALMGVPLAVLSAEGLSRMPRMFSRGMLGVLVVSGLCSMLVAVLCFQGPLFHRFQGPFSWAHSEIMSPVDARLMEKIDQGTVLAPDWRSPLFGDFIVHNRPGTRTIYGLGSLDYGGVHIRSLSRNVQRFFTATSNDWERQQFVRNWCVDYVYCPQTEPVAPEALRQLREATWLREVASEDRAALFEVLKN